MPTNFDTRLPAAAPRLPHFWSQEGFLAFQNLAVQPSDVVLVSPPNTGMTWINLVVFSLLRMDDRGNFRVDYARAPGGTQPVYPESLGLVGTAGSEWCFQDLVEQPEPRLFATHLPAGSLPPGLAERARVIYITRNPKDTLVSKHLLQQTLARDGVLPKEDAVDLDASFNAFNAWPAERCDEPYGSYYGHVRGMCEYVRRLEGRGHLVLYEDLRRDLRGEIRRLAAFLGVKLTALKFEAIARWCSFDETKAQLHDGPCRGVMGVYSEHLSYEQCDIMDRLFKERLGDVAEVQGLQKCMAAPSGSSLGFSALMARCCSGR